MEIAIQKTIAEAIAEIEDNLWCQNPLSVDTMLLALAVLKEYEKKGNDI